MSLFHKIFAKPKIPKNILKRRNVTRYRHNRHNDVERQHITIKYSYNLKQSIVLINAILLTAYKAERNIVCIFNWDAIMMKNICSA